MQKRSSRPYALVYRHYDLPEEFPLVGLLGRDWVTDDSPITSLHFHNCLEIGYCYEGDGVFIIDDQILTFHAHDLSVIFPNQIHRSTSSKNIISKWKWIYLDPEKLIGSLIRPADMNFDRFRFAPLGFQPIVSPAGEENLHELLLEIISELENRKQNYNQVATGLALAFLVRLYRLMPQASPLRMPAADQLGSKAIVPAIDKIARSYMEEIGIEDLARLCHLSTAHFRRVFRSVMNCGPLEYLNLMRVHAACNLLESSRDSIVDIALKTGFRTVSALNRNFRAVTGKAPGHWRKSVLARYATQTGRPV